MIKLTEIKPNPDNPRTIKDESFDKLVKSIQEFPKMMELRPLVVNSENMILGGNKRYEALKKLYKEIPETWVRYAETLSSEEQRRFIVADNVNFGEWDYSDLKENWDIEELSEWGLDVPEFDTDYSVKNQEIDIDAMDSTMTINLKYTESEYQIVKEQLSKIASTPENAVWKLLGNE